MKAFPLLYGVVALTLASCGGTSVSNPTALIDGFDPPMATTGQVLTIYGSNFTLGGAAPQVSIGGLPITPTSYTDTQIVLTLHDGLVAGLVTVTNMNGATSSMYSFTPSASTTVTELEPNDNETTATLVGSNRSFTGTLSSSSDLDAFLVTGLVKNHQYKLHISPIVVPAVAASGTAVEFDSNGDGVFMATEQSAIISLIGSTGTYTVSLEIVLDAVPLKR